MQDFAKKYEIQSSPVPLQEDLKKLQSKLLLELATEAAEGDRKWSSLSKHESQGCCEVMVLVSLFGLLKGSGAKPPEDEQS